MARVYVGTYKKYNEGSINGGWLDLADYPKYGDFLAACRKLHKNERDPEFMIQDCEGFPDGLGCMEWLSESEFNDVKEAMSEAIGSKPNVSITQYSEKSFVVKGDTRPIKEDLKKLGGLWFKKECGWLFSNKKREAVEAYLNGGAVTKTEKAEKNNKFTDWLKEFIETQCKTDSDRKYYTKEYVGAVKIDGHYYLIDKPSINNHFCFHDEGPDYEFYQTLCADDKKMEQYFISENESEFTSKLDRIKDGEEVRIKEGDYLNQFAVFIGCDYWHRQEGREATEEEKKLIVDGLQFGLAQFRKRLDAYLKRYGISKLHTWTYWADA